ncbi:MAG: HDOD domain-containing protein [Rubripirellula sp.]|nr:HDOD domain-containing protein [Rubripirellula sp.]
MALITSSQLEQNLEQVAIRFGLPEGARQVIAAGDQEDQASRALAAWLASDRVVAKRLLRWCNTPLYNQSSPYLTLEEASQVMGVRELSQLAVLAGVRGFFLPNLRIDVYQRATLWNHSIAVGAVASMISRICGAEDPSLVFTAGTLHDIGLRASEQFAREVFGEVLSEVDELSPVHEVERDRFGWDHAQLGGVILRHWGMPEEVQAAARWHHSPECALTKPSEMTVCSVCLADYLCSRSGWAALGGANFAPPDPKVLRRWESMPTCWLCCGSSFMQRSTLRCN